MTATRSDAWIASLDFDEAVSVADAPSLCEGWRDSFADSAEWVALHEVAVPEGDALAKLCRGWDFPAVAVQGLVDQRRGFDEPRVRRLAAHVQWMVAQCYTPTGYVQLGWPPVFSQVSLFYAYAAVGLARRVAVQQAAMGIERRITRATLRDIGQQIFLHHRMHGTIAMQKGWWLSHHLSHHLFRLGRLQFQRSRARRGLGPIDAQEPFIDVHIPEDGPLDGASCDDAFAWSRTFFEQHFPGERPSFFACSSWLLDPVLAELLPASSNILAFQRRFDLDHVREGPSSVFEFVFDRPDLDASMTAEDLASLPRDTRLRATLARHYELGGTIRMGVGTIRR